MHPLKELVDLAIKMRSAQKDYFKSRRDRQLLIRARVLESEFDKAVHVSPYYDKGHGSGDVKVTSDLEDAPKK